MKIIADKPITINEKTDYLASGGQAKVYVKGYQAFKIYHDPKDSIPIEKITELSQIKSGSVLGPKGPITDTNGKLIGFWMPYEKNTCPFCWIFSNSYKSSKNVSTSDINFLVTEIHDKTEEIHRLSILLADPNEMNFLLNESSNLMIYFIDVDNYQTPRYPAVAIAPQIRDRTIPIGTYTKETDYFGLAVVTFQMYTGLHPYRGKHPNFSKEDIRNLKLMDLGISVFNKDVTTPPGILDKLPKNMKSYYEGVFERKERKELPSPGKSVDIPIQAIQSTTAVEVKILHEYDDTILDILLLPDGKTYIITKKSLYEDSHKIAVLPTNNRYSIAMVEGHNLPVIADIRFNKTIFRNIETFASIGEIQSEGYFQMYGCVYTLNLGYVIENSFKIIGNKIVHLTKEVEKVMESSSKMFRGIICQNIFGKIYVSFPLEKGICLGVWVPELEGHRVLDARHEVASRRVMEFISEKSGKYYITNVYSDRKYSTIFSRTQKEITSFEQSKIVVLSNGVSATYSEDELTLALHPSISTISNLSFGLGNLFTDGSKVLLADGKILKQVSTK